MPDLLLLDLRAVHPREDVAAGHRVDDALRWRQDRDLLGRACCGEGEDCADAAGADIWR